MALSIDDTISVLNNLIETCKDGEEGFRSAAEGTDDSQLRALFNEYAMQRSGFAAELQRQVAGLGGSPERSGSLAGAAHRGWMDIKSAVMGRDNKAIVNEAERGEDSAVEQYTDALARDLPSDLRSIVERQARMVKEAHDRIRDLKLQYETGTPRTRTGGIY